MFWTADTGIDGQTPVDLDELDLVCIDPLPSRVWYQDMADFAEPHRIPTDPQSGSDPTGIPQTKRDSAVYPGTSIQWLRCLVTSGDAVEQGSKDLS